MPMKGRRCNARSNEHNNTTLKKKKNHLALISLPNTLITTKKKLEQWACL